MRNRGSPIAFVVLVVVPDCLDAFGLAAVFFEGGVCGLHRSFCRSFVFDDSVEHAKHRETRTRAKRMCNSLRAI